MTKRSLGIAPLFALAACSAASDESNIMIDNEVNAAEAAGANVETLPPDETVATGDLEVAEGNLSSRDSDPVGGMPLPPSTGAPAIPAQYHGRWGMTAADCQRGRSDAKGLLTIDGTTLQFYESRATLKEQRPAIATSFSGLFAFAGEGQTWEKVMTFTRTGDALKRAESDATYNYRRC